MNITSQILPASRHRQVPAQFTVDRICRTQRPVGMTRELLTGHCVMPVTSETRLRLNHDVISPTVCQHVVQSKRSLTLGDYAFPVAAARARNSLPPSAQNASSKKLLSVGNSRLFAARCYASTAYVVMRCLSVCLSRS